MLQTAPTPSRAKQQRQLKTTKAAPRRWRKGELEKQLETSLCWARKSLRKAGFNPWQARDEEGKWTGGGGTSITSDAGDSSGGGGRRISNHEKLQSQLHEANRHLQSMRYVDDDDEDKIAAQERVENLQERLRQSNIARARNAAAQSGQPYGADATQRAQQRQTNEAREAQDFYEKNPELNERARFDRATQQQGPQTARSRLNERLNAYAPPPPKAAEDTRNFVQTFGDISSRVAVTAGLLAGVAGRIQGIRDDPQDYARVGGHVRSIQDDLKAARTQLKYMPTELRAAGRELEREIIRIQTKTRLLQAKIKAQAKLTISDFSFRAAGSKLLAGARRLNRLRFSYGR